MTSMVVFFLVCAVAIWPNQAGPARKLTLQQRLCYRFSRLTDTQVEICLNDYTGFAALLRGIRQSYASCIRTMEHHKWDCRIGVASSSDGVRSMMRDNFWAKNVAWDSQKLPDHSIVGLRIPGTPEAARLEAITSFGMASELVETCLRGKSSCGCPKIVHQGVGPVYEKCPDMLSNAVEMVRSFLTSESNAQTPKRRVQLLNMEWGLQQVAKHFHKSCQCYPSSSNCTKQSCWFERKEEDTPRIRRILLEAPVKKITDEEATAPAVGVAKPSALAYLKDSDWCVEEWMRIPHRVCLQNAEGEPNCAQTCCTDQFGTKVEQIACEEGYDFKRGELEACQAEGCIYQNGPSYTYTPDCKASVTRHYCLQ